MKFTAILAAAAVSAGMVSAATSLCDKYTTALLKNNTAENQYTLLVLLVNTALIGNYSNPATMVTPAKNAVTGILGNGTYMGTPVSLIQYFDGSLLSTNQGGKAASVNFLDGGGAAPLLNSTPAFANATSSNQYTLVTHLYQLFGSLLGCSMQSANSMAFPAYQGDLSMSEVHAFMNIDAAENGYFIQEVGLAATSFGVTTEDATAVGTALTNLFNYKCAPPAPLYPGASANYSQSICVAADCPTANMSVCTQSGMNYGNGSNNVEPAAAAASSTSGSSGGGSDGASNEMIFNAVGILALATAGLVALSL